MTAMGAAGWGCSAPDPGEIGVGPGGKRSGNFDGGAGNPNNGGNGNGNGNGNGGGGGDGGGGGGGGGGGDNAFAGAPAYQAGQTGQPTNNAGHPNGGNPVGLACLDCHGPQNTKKFSFGGTVYKTSGGAPVGAGVEVRLRTPNGDSLSVYTDATGNFYAETATFPALPAGTQVGVRDGTNTKPMVGKLVGADGSCAKASCHQSPGQGKIYLQ
ncbi:carboxypeptidase-like regulatory domain-containing protein [Pendulispora albinea]|uniref:Carboxypeptidase-like regulatory domain-containing protein n=1 Tax=Pendulispora albinea TaxID=2741071 RepID=A0ABZ2LX58_9BACT